MENSVKLYDLLIEMEEAAGRCARQEVMQIRQRFSAEYTRVMPQRYESGSLADLYDQARNKLINAIDDLVSPSLVQKQQELVAARKIISMIPRPEH